MADLEIGGLPAADPLDGSEEVEIVQGGNSRKSTTGAISRVKITANRTYYVSTAGSDSNTGLSAGSPFATVNKARDVILTLDLNGFTVTIQHAAAQTATSGLSFGSPPVGGNVTLDMGGSTLNVTGGDGVFVTSPMTLTVQNGTLRTTTSGYPLHAQGPGAKISLGAGLTFGASAGSHMRAMTGGYVGGTPNYTISGNAPSHIEANIDGIVEIAGQTVTLTGTPAFSTAFAVFQAASTINAYGVTFSGAATGTRYFGEQNAVCKVYGGGASYFPGNAAGNVYTGAVYG